MDRIIIMPSATNNAPLKKMLHLYARWWAVVAFVASGMMLAAAWAFQIWGDLAPCPLCLRQREIYWAALGVSLVSAIWGRFTGSKGSPRVFNFVLFAIFFTGAAVASFHAGVENGWWEGPKTCGAAMATALDLKDMSAFLNGGSFMNKGCSEAPWRVLGISMAGFNAIISIILSLMSLMAAIRLRPSVAKQAHKAT
jgi:disulfide bond formation protein DsbB